MKTIQQILSKLLADKNFSEILRGSVYSLGARIIATGIALVTNMLIAKHYGAGSMGVLAIVNSVLALTTIITVLGTNSAILRFIPEEIAKFSTTSAYNVFRSIYLLIIALSVLVSLALFFASGLIAEQLFHKPYLQPVLSLSAGFIIFVSLVTFLTGAIRGLKLVRFFAFMQILLPVSMLLTILAATFLSNQPHDPVYSQLTAYCITALTGSWFVWRVFKKRIQPNDISHQISLRKICSTSLPMMFSTSMAFLMGQSSIIILGMTRTESEVGIYSIAVKLATLTVFSLQAINSMAAPKFSELFHQNRLGALIRVAQQSSRLIFFTTVPVLLGLTLFGPFVLSNCFGEQFSNAYFPLLLLIVGQFINAISGSTGLFMNMTGDQQYFGKVMAITAILHVVLCILFIPSFGMIGAALTGMSCQVFWNLITLIRIKNKYGYIIGYIPFFNRKIVYSKQ